MTSRDDHRHLARCRPNRWRSTPEHLALLRLCVAPISLADLASDLDLPLGVVRILVGDLREHELIAVRQPGGVSTAA